MSLDQTENSIRIKERVSQKRLALFLCLFKSKKKDEHNFLHVDDRKIQFIL